MNSINCLRVHPNVQTESLVKTILSRCKKEKERKHLHVPLKDNALRVAYYTGLPISNIYQCVEDNCDCCTISSNHDPLKNSDHIVIMSCLRELYKQKSLVKMFNLYVAVCESWKQKDQAYTFSFEQFCQKVSLLGYCYVPLTSGDSMIMENPKLTFERYHYLKKLEKIRNSNVNIYYLDERILRKNLCTIRSDFVKNDCDHKMLCFAISRYGFVKSTTLFRDQALDYVKWITETLLPDLVPSSVIIINSYHGQYNNEIITKFHSKKDMLTWLKNHNIPCSDEMHKAKLYELIYKSSLNSPQNPVKTFLKSNGYTVLTVPSSLQNFTPTELLWCDVQTAMQNRKPLSARSVVSYFESVSKSQWASYEDTIVHQENLIYGIDLEVEKSLECYTLDPVYSAKLSCSAEYDINIVDEDI